MHLKNLAAALAAPAAVSAQLNDLAVAAGLKYFGSAVRETAVNDTAYMAIVNDTAEIGAVVPENGMKWDATEPEEGVFSYTQGDIVADIALANGQYLRCTNLVWDSQLPTWVTSDTWTADNLTVAIQTYIANVVGHYAGQCYAWDVVNEAVSDDGGWTDDVFYEVLGTDYFAIAFSAAGAADPNAKLYYNDYNLEYGGTKVDYAVELVQIVQAAGAPIDGVGFEGHMIVGETPDRASIAAQLEVFTALGLEVAITELDVRQLTLPPTAADNLTQATNYADMVGACLDVEDCIGVTVWGFTDRYSWIPDTFPGEGDACLYDVNLQKKEAWTSVSSVLAAAATSTSSSTTSSTVGVTTTTTTTVLTTTTTGPTTTTSSSGALQSEYGQCGGSNWAGPTACVSPYTCEYENPYYYQCL